MPLNHPAPGNAGIAPQLTIAHQLPGVPEPERWPTMIMRYVVIVAVGSAILSLCAQQGDGGSAVANPHVMSLPEKELVRVWWAPNASVEQREAAVGRCFTNGIPLSTIIGVLGTNFTAFSRFHVGTGQQLHAIIYHDKGVIIGSTADVKTNLQGAFFTGTGRIVIVHSSDHGGQPSRPANGSQPIRSETNRTSSAAGSRR